MSNKRKYVILVLLAVIAASVVAAYFYFSRTPTPADAEPTGIRVEDYVEADLPADASDELKADKLRLLASLSEQTEDYQGAVDYYKEIEKDYELTESDMFNLSQLYKLLGDDTNHRKYLEKSGIDESQLESEKDTEEDSIQCNEDNTECVQ